jgi:hypothetical protein
VARVSTAVLAILLALACVQAAAAAARDPRLAREQHTTSDSDIAKRVVLTTAEMGGWQTSPLDPNDEELPRCPQMTFNESDLVETGEGLSPAFVRNRGTGLEVVYAASGVYRTTRMSNVAWNRSAKKKLPACLGHYLATAYSEPRARLRVVSAKYMPFPNVSGRTVHIRIVLKDPAGKRIYADIVGIQNGRVQVGLNTLSQGHPFPITLLRDLAAGLGQRMARTVPTA